MKTRESATSSVNLALWACKQTTRRSVACSSPSLRFSTVAILSDLLRPHAGLSFRLGVAAGLASVTVVDDDDFQALRTADTSHESHTPSRQSPPAIFLIS